MASLTCSQTWREIQNPNVRTNWCISERTGKILLMRPGSMLFRETAPTSPEAPVKTAREMHLSDLLVVIYIPGE